MGFLYLKKVVHFHVRSGSVFPNSGGDPRSPLVTGRLVEDSRTEPAGSGRRGSVDRAAFRGLAFCCACCASRSSFFRSSSCACGRTSGSGVQREGSAEKLSPEEATFQGQLKQQPTLDDNKHRSCLKRKTITQGG